MNKEKQAQQNSQEKKSQEKEDAEMNPDTEETETTNPATAQEIEAFRKQALKLFWKPLDGNDIT